jgi:lysophospholipase L1-like esterase
MSNMPVKKVLCFGDSNTWGYIPTLGQKDLRYPPNQRWTGILQSKLPECVIIEEGLNSRTTNIDDPDFSGKNGLKALPGVLQHHQPIDLLLIMLGTNDLKKKFNRQPHEIANGLEALVSLAREMGVRDILILSPAIPKLKSIYDSYQYSDLEPKARLLAPLYENMANKHGAFIIDIAKVVSSSDTDGAHLDQKGHEILASIVHRFIQNWLSEQAY